MQLESLSWFPGHMTKTRRMVASEIGSMDAVCEIIDARIPRASRNPDLDDLTAGKPRIVVLNRVDQADPKATKQWAAWFRAQGYAVLEVDAKSGAGVKQFAPAVRTLLADKLRAYEEKGQVGRVLRVMVLGIPNVGKSTFINKVSGRKTAKAEDRPGVTRGKQWVPVDKMLELLDTPGILWPKFEDPDVGVRLPGRARSTITSLTWSLSPAGCSSGCASFTPARLKRAINSRPTRKRPATSCSKPRRESAAFSFPAAKSIPSAWRTSCSMNSARASSGA